MSNNKTCKDMEKESKWNRTKIIVNVCALVLILIVLFCACKYFMCDKPLGVIMLMPIILISLIGILLYMCYAFFIQHDNQQIEILRLNNQKEDKANEREKEKELFELRKQLKEIEIQHEKEIKEQEAQNVKYHFAEHVVGDICKNNNLDAAAIRSVESMIRGVLYQYDNWTDIREDGNKYIFEMIDVYCKKLVFTIDKGGHVIDVSSPDGNYVLRNGTIISVKSNMIQSVTKV